jgi:carbamoyl-phosphate synthase large subunit
MLGKKISIKLSPMKVAPHVGVKVPQFSFMRLSGADPVLGVEMLSTGEVACLGENFSDAFSKALQSAEFTIPPKGGSVLISVGGDDERKARVVPTAKAFAEMGFKIYATANTAKVLNAKGVATTVLHKVKYPDVTPNILDYLQERKIDLVINVPIANRRSTIDDILTDGYIIRRQAVEFNIPVITNLQLAEALVEVMKQKDKNGNTIKSLNEYMDELPWKQW